MADVKLEMPSNPYRAAVLLVVLRELRAANGVLSLSCRNRTRLSELGVLTHDLSWAGRHLAEQGIAKIEAPDAGVALVVCVGVNLDEILLPTR